ncbi:MAG TPA: hypothetical protein VJS86_00295 [Arthrobacter sp.]|nr:hypothetical protein [Arthrobacter sp.]
MGSVLGGEDREPPAGNDPERGTRGPKWFGHIDAAADTIRLQLTVRELLL